MDIRKHIFYIFICLSQGVLAAPNLEEESHNRGPNLVLEKGNSAGQMHAMIGLGEVRPDRQDSFLILNLQRMISHHTSIRTLFYSEWRSNSVGFSQTGFGLGAAYHLFPQRAVNLSLYAEAGIAFADLISSKPDAAIETALGVAIDYHFNSFTFLHMQWRKADTTLDGRGLGSRRRRDLMSLSLGILF